MIKSPYLSKYKVCACREYYSRVLQSPPHSIPFRRHAETVYNTYGMWSRCIIAGPGPNDRCSPESVGCTQERTTEFGDISAEPKVIVNRSNPVRCFPRAHGKESEPVPSADDRYVESAREGDSVPVMILLSFWVSRWTTFQWDISLDMDGDQRISDTPGVMEESKRNRMQ